jgi:hypothetical protein
VPPIFTEPRWNLHTAEEIGIDDSRRLARRTIAIGPNCYALSLIFKNSTRAGSTMTARFPTFLDVVNHYDTTFKH